MYNFFFGYDYFYYYFDYYIVIVLLIFIFRYFGKKRFIFVSFIEELEYESEDMIIFLLIKILLGGSGIEVEDIMIIVKFNVLGVKFIIIIIEKFVIEEIEVEDRIIMFLLKG